MDLNVPTRGDLMRDEHPLPGADHVVDGVRLHVVHHGAGAGLPVLLLHGVPTWSYLWRDVQRDLEHMHPTYAPDLLGLGCSERPVHGRYDLASQARVLRALLDDLGLDRVAVVGHDAGGGVAVHLAALAPERVAALVLVDAPMYAEAWPVPAVAAWGLPGFAAGPGAALRTFRAAGERWLGAQLPRGLSRKVLREYAEPLLGADGVRGVAAFVRALDAGAVEHAFALVCKEPPPTLVLWGEHDGRYSPAHGRRIAAEVSGASFVSVADAGHLLPEERPERVAEELAAFLAELP